MLCLCKKQVSALDAKLATLDFRFNLNLPFDLPKLSLVLGAMESARLAASIDLKLLPPALAALNLSADLKLSAAGAMQLTALGMGLQGIKLALGIDLTSPGAAAQLAPLATSAAAHLPSLSALLKAELAQLLGLLPLASAVLKAKALGIDLLRLDASAQLAAALSLAIKLSLPLPVLSARLSLMMQLAALVVQIKLAFGIDLLQPGGIAQLQAALSLLANIQLPQIRINLPPLANLLAISAAFQTVKLAFGVDLGQPGAAAQLSLILRPLLSLKLPQILLAMPPLDVAALKLALSMNLKGLDLPKLSLVLGAGLPNLGSLGALVSLVASLKAAFAINLVGPVLTLGCGTECPLAAL